MNNYVYMLDGKAYINITNRCPNDCVFCIRKTGSGVAGTPLWLTREPTADDVSVAFAALEPVDNEVVFCGYGEPTERMEVLTECARRLKAAGYSLRLDTNGLGSFLNGRDITAELGDFDTVSVSLNASDAVKYYALTHSVFGKHAFRGVCEFTEACVARGINTVMTVVDIVDEEEIRRCREVAASIGAPLRVREYVDDNYDGK